jgi:polar amino acid transport system permease protein
VEVEAGDVTHDTVVSRAFAGTTPPTTSSSISDRRQAIGWWIFVAAVGAFLTYKLLALNWGLVWRISPLLLQGFGITWLLTVLSIGVGMLIGVLLAFARISRVAPLRYLAIAYIETIRATPQLMVIFWIFFTYPVLMGHQMTPWSGASISLTLIASAYLAEVVRGGVLSVPKIQAESATVIGLTRAQSFFYVLLPQACRNMLPAFTATAVMSFKTTSLVYVIGMIDFFRSATLMNNRYFAPATIYTVVAIVYFLSCFALSRLLSMLDPKYRL